MIKTNTYKKGSDNMDTYRFDDAHEKVYELDGDHYIFIGIYFAFKINSKMTDKKKAQIVDDEMLYNDLE